MARPSHYHAISGLTAMPFRISLPASTFSMRLFWTLRCSHQETQIAPMALEWVAIAFSRGSSWPRDRTWVSCIVGRRFTVWANREVFQTQFRNAASYQQIKKTHTLIILQVYKPIVRIFHFKIYLSQKPKMTPQKIKKLSIQLGFKDVFQLTS